MENNVLFGWVTMLMSSLKTNHVLFWSLIITTIFLRFHFHNFNWLLSQPQVFYSMGIKSQFNKKHLLSSHFQHKRIDTSHKTRSLVKRQPNGHIFVDSPSIRHRNSTWKVRGNYIDFERRIHVEIMTSIRRGFDFQNRRNIDEFSTWIFLCRFDVKST